MGLKSHPGGLERRQSCTAWLKVPRSPAPRTPLILYHNATRHLLREDAAFFITDDTINEKIKDIAINISKSIGLKFGSIDIIETEENKFLVMEGNSGVMMDNFISLNKNGYKLAKDIYKEVIIKMFE